MLESLRGLGYTTAGALADIIDNSISAGASEVKVEFAWAGAASRISVLDDGHGMDDAGLERAMRLGRSLPRSFLPGLVAIVVAVSSVVALVLEVFGR